MTSALPGYSVVDGRHDEAVTADGELRPAWRSLAKVLADLGPAELDRRRRDSARVVEALGAGHLFHDDGRDASRPWRVDPIPFVISGDEWAELERGIAQRVRLVDHVLGDVYREPGGFGPSVHPAMLGLPSWCASAQGVTPVGGRHITVYAADLVRLADGGWRVLAEHTDAPSGAGYALLNREAVGVLLPEIGRALRVTALGPYLGATRDALAGLAPAGRDSPRVVVLTTGLGHPSYFEHSYLATLLGYHLAELGDVAVSEGRAWLRSIDGLEPIDVLLRRVDGEHLDPLEQPAAYSGVPGLFWAHRLGGIGLANAPGAGFAGALGLTGFLDRVAEQVLGETLRLRGVTSLWCSDADCRRELEDSPESYVLHDLGAPDGTSMASAFAADLDDGELGRWRRILDVAPHRVVAQPRARFATSPVLTAEGLAPGTVVLRVQAVHGTDGITVMPGGLARVVDPAQPVVHQRSGLAKDTLVLDDQMQQRLPELRVRGGRIPQIDLGRSLPVRTAESLLWVSRHAERAEAIARTARSALGMVQADPALLTAGEGAWRRFVVRSLHRVAGLPLGDPDTSWRDALRDAETALAQRLDALALTASGVRPFVSSSTWLVLGELGALAAKMRDGATGLGARADTLDEVVVRLAALSGLAVESTVRGPAWRYLDLGRRLERASAVIDALDPELGSDLPASVRSDVFDHVLRANESLIAYRRRFRSDADLVTLVDLLVRDHTNPRSLQFQLDSLRQHLVSLAGRDPGGELASLVDAAERALSVDDASIARIVVDSRSAILSLGARLVVLHFSDPAVLRPLGGNWDRGGVA
jgi:uncharacterized circularly permuted ATP-grasp superfamily protein/uncharacterized alpha-E superfamily protein